jgi:hypothetical protein
LRKGALFHIVHAIKSEHETAAIPVVILLLRLKLVGASLWVFDLPENNDRAFLAFSGESAQLIRLAVNTGAKVHQYAGVKMPQ